MRPTTTNEIAGLLEKQWMRTLCGGDPRAMVSLYAPSAILVPTFGPAPLVGRAALLGYFRNFLGDHPQLCGHVRSSHALSLGPGRLVSSGLYLFHWKGQKGTESQAARFTYVFQREKDGRWSIVTHHSSAVPA